MSTPIATPHTDDAEMEWEGQVQVRYGLEIEGIHGMGGCIHLTYLAKKTQVGRTT